MREEAPVIRATGSVVIHPPQPTVAPGQWSGAVRRRTSPARVSPTRTGRSTPWSGRGRVASVEVMDTRGIMSVGAVGVEPQVWARRASIACLVCVLPSIAWRLAMIAGIETGLAEAGEYRATGANVAYVLGLDAAQLVAALLCVGLAMSWGERVPGWLPGLGGRRIHRLVPVVAGALGLVLVSFFIVSVLASFVPTWVGAADGWTPDAAMSPAQRAVLFLAYAPVLAWPALLAVALVGYWRRRAPRPAG